MLPEDYGLSRRSPGWLAFCTFLVRGLPLMTRSQLVKLWGADLKSYADKLSPHDFETGRNMLRLLEVEAGFLVSTQVAFRWPAPPPFAMQSHHSPADHEIIYRHGLWTASSVVQHRVYAPTEKALRYFEETAAPGIVDTALFQETRRILPDVTEKLRTRHAEFIAPRVYLADWQLRFSLDGCPREEICVTTCTGRFEPVARHLLRNGTVIVDVHVPLLGTADEIAELRAAAAGSGRQEHFDFEFR